MRFWVWGWIRV
jgi:hypothetical protein